MAPSRSATSPAPRWSSGVRDALLAPLHEAIKASHQAAKADLSERKASGIGGYQALKQNVLDQLQKSPFQRAATANPTSCASRRSSRARRTSSAGSTTTAPASATRSPTCGRGARPVTSPTSSRGAKWGTVFHNFIIEVKGRLDDKDKEKARRGQHWCEILTEHDTEPWHYLMLIENGDSGRQDIAWWESAASQVDRGPLPASRAAAALPAAGRTGTPNLGPGRADGAVPRRRAGLRSLGEGRRLR